MTSVTCISKTRDPTSNQSAFYLTSCDPLHSKDFTHNAPLLDLSHNLFLIVVRNMFAVFLRCFEFENSHWSVWNDQ